jgi:hypothetical protein
VLGIGGELEGITGVIRGGVWDQQERLALPLNVVVDRDPVYLGLCHGSLPSDD